MTGGVWIPSQAGNDGGVLGMTEGEWISSQAGDDGGIWIPSQAGNDGRGVILGLDPGI